MVSALKDLGISDTSLDDHVFDPDKTYLRIPMNTFRIEFLPRLKGLTSFSSSYKESEKVILDGIQISFISLNDLIANKQKVNRDIDKQDVDQLKKINKI